MKRKHPALSAMIGAAALWLVPAGLAQSAAPPETRQAAADTASHGPDTGRASTAATEAPRNAATESSQEISTVAANPPRAIEPAGPKSLATADQARSSKSAKDRSWSTRSGGEVASAPAAPPPQDGRASANDASTETLAPTGRSSAEQFHGDAALASAAQQIRVALDGDEQLRRADIRVTTANGRIVLQGSVKDDEAKRRAAEIVAQALVDNQLEVKSR